MTLQEAKSIAHHLGLTLRKVAPLDAPAEPTDREREDAEHEARIAREGR